MVTDVINQPQDAEKKPKKAKAWVEHWGGVSTAIAKS